jgi:hypothetical protein
MTAIPVVFSFARSGGTLVNQLLGVHPDCLVLSEVNPAASLRPLLEQAVDWLRLVESSEMAALEAKPYGQRIASLHERARARGRTLVVRDWPTVNFVSGCTPDPIAPSGLLEQPVYLRRGGLEVRPLVITRRAGAVMRSARRHFPRMPTENELAQAYVHYARAVAPLPRVHLEDLRARPEAMVRRIVETLGLPPADPVMLLRDFHRFDKCTGNNTLAEPAESSRASTVLPPEPEVGPAAVHPALAEADALLGYE